MKKWAIVLALLLPGFISLWGQTPAGQDDDALYAKDMIKVGEAFPTVSFGTALDGRVLSVKDFAGKYLVLDFWATWCPDCRKDVPALVEAYKRFASDQVVFVSISWDQDRERLEKFMADNGITWTQVCDFKPRTGFSGPMDSFHLYHRSRWQSPARNRHVRQGRCPALFLVISIYP